jgi:hypothetical protein
MEIQEEGSQFGCRFHFAQVLCGGFAAEGERKKIKGGRKEGKDAKRQGQKCVAGEAVVLARV